MENTGENMESDQPKTKDRKRSRIQVANRALILDAALEVFSTDGYRGATVDRIAEAAGMSKPNLLYYFPSKDEIYRETLESTIEGWLEPFSLIDPSGDPVSELKEYIIHKIRMSQENPTASRLFANEIARGAPLLKPFLETRLKDLVDKKAAILDQWMRDGKLRRVDPYHLIFMIWATTQHYADFEVQIGAILGGRAKSNNFYDEAAKAVLAVIMGGIGLRDEG